MPPDAAPGVSKAEAKALVATYYVNHDFESPVFNKKSLAALMDRSVNFELDGELAEGQASALILALASSGDEFFASVLESRSGTVRAAVERSISSAWNYNGLNYPKTEAICSESEWSEQGIK